MAWTPSADLGAVNENVTFSHSITYTEIDELTSLETSYPVTITANEPNPDSISIVENTISGFYFDSFNSTITYKNNDGQFPVVSKFSLIDNSSLYQMISYKASTEISKTFSYTAVAKDGLVVKATQIYTKTVSNNWTSGKNSLQFYVGLTN
jgi:hypothetical protein